MKSHAFTLMAIACALSSYSQSMDSLADKLLNTVDYQSKATFEALLPSAEDPVVYDIVLQSSAQPSDSLAPCDYLITWQTVSPSGPLNGFSAYFNGNHYRFRNNRLQEYHIDANPAVFAPTQGKRRFSSGVQATAQFADMLPQFIGMKLMDIMQDSSYIYDFHPDTLVTKKRCIVVNGAKRNAGYDAVKFTYVFDHETMLPLSIELENNPGSISEQLVSMAYSPVSDAIPVELTEEGLIERWPEVFEKFRESTFRVENLVGQPLPEFNSQVLGASDRYAHHQGEKLPANTIIVALDPEIATTSSTIQAIRDAAMSVPSSVDVIWAFNTNNDGQISAVVSPIAQSETALKSANSLLRNCGITLFPTILIIDRDAIIHDVISGYNKNLSEVVIQKISLLP